MNRADIIRKLHEIAHFQLLAEGHGRPIGSANQPSENTKRPGLKRMYPETPGNIRSTVLGSELNVDLMTVFAGAWCIWDVPLVLEENGYLEGEEDAIWEASSDEEGERLIHPICASGISQVLLDFQTDPGARAGPRRGNIA